MKTLSWLRSKQPIFPYADFVEKVNDWKWQDLSPEDLKEFLWTDSVHDMAKRYSLLKEIVFRCTGKRLFDSQIAAARSMREGRIAQLPTGEGKTLSAVVAAADLALDGRQVHILVFNDYLARRDYVNNCVIFQACGLSSGCIEQGTGRVERRKAYNRPICYISAKEAGFDYLRDFLWGAREEQLRLPYQAAVVDEADSILIDEARIPLVLAGGEGVAEKAAEEADRAVRRLDAGCVKADRYEKVVWLTEQGVSQVEELLGLENLYGEGGALMLSLVNAALEARYLLKRNEDYLVREGQIQVIDQATGRIAASRRFPELLQRAVEIKEAVGGGGETILCNSIPLQFFLLGYDFLCGMTGTAKASEKELKSMYGLEVDVIPPHKPCIRVDHEDRVFFTEKEKRQAVLSEIRQAGGKGQPVLIGTGSVEESRQYSALLDSQGLAHCVLNAENDQQEAEIIARAGEPYRITVSTNMAGRGVDIRLGGREGQPDPGLEGRPKAASNSNLQSGWKMEPKARAGAGLKTGREACQGGRLGREAALAAGGLYVIGCGMPGSRRTELQLRGRAGRQGEPGESRFFISLDEPAVAAWLHRGKTNALKKRIMALEKKETKTKQDEEKGKESRKERREGGAEAERNGKREQKRQEELRKAVRLAQRAREGRDSEARYMLEKYAYVVELHRREISAYRDEILDRKAENGKEQAKKQLALYFINRHWADYLSAMENLRSGIHLTIIGGGNPIDEYQKRAREFFGEMLEEIERDIDFRMKSCQITNDGIDMRAAGLHGASSTCTYMIDESRGQFSRISGKKA